MAESIRVWAAPVEDSKSFFGGKFEAVLVELDSETLRSSVQRFVALVQPVLSSPQDEKGISLTEVSLELEISAEGGVNLVGTAKARAKGGIKLTFRRG